MGKSKTISDRNDRTFVIRNFNPTSAEYGHSEVLCSKKRNFTLSLRKGNHGHPWSLIFLLGAMSRAAGRSPDTAQLPGSAITPGLSLSTQQKSIAMPRASSGIVVALVLLAPKVRSTNTFHLLKENPMQERPCRVGFFRSKAKAERAVRDLLNAGFSEKELAVICPQDGKAQVAPDLPRAEPPGAHGAEALVEGGAIGAAIGGIALAATALATGGAALLPAIPVLVGGGAIAGGFSSLILSDGYGKGVGEYFFDAIHQGKVVVGVEVEGEDSTIRLPEAQRILGNAGGELPPTQVIQTNGLTTGKKGQSAQENTKKE
jgi:hypothetical protein